MLRTGLLLASVLGALGYFRYRKSLKTLEPATKTIAMAKSTRTFTTKPERESPSTRSSQPSDSGELSPKSEMSFHAEGNFSVGFRFAFGGREGGSGNKPKIEHEDGVAVENGNATSDVSSSSAPAPAPARASSIPVSDISPETDAEQESEPEPKTKPISTGAAELEYVPKLCSALALRDYLSKHPKTASGTYTTDMENAED